jgi:Aspartyl protease
VFEVPFHFAAPGAPYVVVDARIGARRHVPTLIDTGDATPYAVVFTPRLLAPTKARLTGAQLTSRAAIGSTPMVFRSTAITNFTVGPLRIDHPTAAAADAVETIGHGFETPFDAVAGEVFLRGHRLAIDYRAQRLTFDGPAPNAAPMRFTYAPKRPLPLVRVMVNGVGPFNFILDTGASLNIVSPAVARAAHLRARRATRLSGAGGTADGVRSVARSLSFGTVTRRMVRVTVADVLRPAAAESGAPIDGILSPGALRTRRLTIDFAARRFWLVR